MEHLMMVTIVYLSVCFFIFLTLDNMLLEKRNSFTFKLVFLPPAQYLCHNSHLINACWRIVSHRKMIKTENWLSSPVYSFWQIGYSSITFMSSLDYSFQRCEHASGSSMDPEPGPSMSDVSEVAACPPSPIAEDPPALPFPTSPPSSSQ